MRRRKALLIGVLIAAALATLYTPSSLSRWRTEDDIREAVFRYQMQHIGADMRHKADAYYLSVTTFWFDWSPSDGFLSRFMNQKPPVMPVSQCTAEADGVKNKTRWWQNEGLILSVGSVKWISDREAEVEGGYFEHGTSASGNIYRVIKRHGRWVVVHDRLIWIS